MKALYIMTEAYRPVMLTFISICFFRIWLVGSYRFSSRLKIRIDDERVANLIVMVFEKKRRTLN